MSHRDLLLIASLGTAFALIGCGGSARSLCGDVCDCTGCSDKELDDCIDSVEDQQKAADDEGCADPYDAVLSCYGDQLECRDGEVDLDGCDSEEEELRKCGGAGFGGIGTNQCQRAVAICARESGGQAEGEVECSGITACYSACIVDLGSCDFSNEELAACASGCG